jgi:hypothetical protein
VLRLITQKQMCATAKVCQSKDNCKRHHRGAAAAAAAAAAAGGGGGGGAHTLQQASNLLLVQLQLSLYSQG